MEDRKRLLFGLGQVVMANEVEDMVSSMMKKDGAFLVIRPFGWALFCPEKIVQRSFMQSKTSLLILNGEGLWLKRRRHSKRMVPGNLFYCLKGKALLYL